MDERDRADGAPKGLARLPRASARVWLALMLILPPLAAAPHAPLRMPPPPSVRVYRDDDLYVDTVRRVSSGDDYYRAAADEQRRHGYPTSPGPVFREPWLARLLAAIPSQRLRDFAVYPIYAALVSMFARELLARPRPFAQTAYITACAASGVGMMGVAHASYFHEIWAAGLLGLSLLLYRPGRAAPSILLAFAACLIRELALPALGVMMLFALGARRWREAAGWFCAIGGFVAVYLVHLHATAGLAHPGDLVSPGWTTFTGWRLILLAGRYNVAFTFLPDWAIAAGLSLAVTGLLGGRDERAWRAGAIASGYMTGLLVFGRENTAYWGELFAPLVGVGLALAPRALADLAAAAGVRTARRPRGLAVSGQG